MKSLTDRASYQDSHSGAAIILILLLFLAPILFNSFALAEETSTAKSVKSADTVSDYRQKTDRLVGIAIRGDASASEELDKMYKDSEAVNWFRRAGEQGDPVAQLMLGRMFDK